MARRYLSAEKFRTAREAAGLTGLELCERAGLRKWTSLPSAIETGKVQNIDRAVLLRFCKVMGVKLSEVLADYGQAGKWLWPFFSYFGGKWKKALLYPQPRHSTIVEPFAGSAGYAVRFHQHNVVLCDIDPVIAGIWEYLIKVSPEEMMGLPELDGLEGCISNLDAPQEAKWLMGFWYQRAGHSPTDRAHSWNGLVGTDKAKATHSIPWPAAKVRLAAQVQKIRHWKVYNCGFEDCPVEGEATWFVDPPYQSQPDVYSFSVEAVDYERLGKWCKSREGLVIVCENTGADWLPFRHFMTTHSCHGYEDRGQQKNREAIWISSEVRSQG